MTQGTLPDFSGIYDDESTMYARVRACGLTAFRGSNLFDRPILHVTGDDLKSLYFIEHLPGGRIYLTDGRIGYNECRFAKELKELRGGRA